MTRKLSTALLLLALLPLLTLFIPVHAQAQKWVIYGADFTGGKLPFNVTLVFAKCSLELIIFSVDSTTGRFSGSVKLDRFDVTGAWIRKKGCDVGYEIVKYRMLVYGEVVEYVAIVLEEKYLSYNVNPSCIIKYYTDPAQQWPSTVYSFEPPTHLVLMDAPLDTFKQWIAEELEVIQSVLGEEKPESILNSIWRWVNAIVVSIPSALRLVGEGIRVMGSAVGGVVEGFKALALVIGKPGDPEATYFTNMYRLQLSVYLEHPTQGEVIRDVLECRKPLKEVSGLLRTYREKDLGRTLCDVEKEAPKGMIGFITASSFVLLAVRDFVSLIALHFIEINAAIIAAILAYSTARSIELKSIKPLSAGVKAIYKIFKFYYRIALGVVNLVLRAVQVIANVVTALHAVANAVKTVVEKIISAIKWLITALATLI